MSNADVASKWVLLGSFGNVGTAEGASSGGATGNFRRKPGLVSVPSLRAETKIGISIDDDCKGCVVSFCASSPQLFFHFFESAPKQGAAVGKVGSEPFLVCMSTELMTSSHETQVTAKRIPRQYTVQNETSIFDRLCTRENMFDTSLLVLTCSPQRVVHLFFICSFPFPTSSSDVLSFLSMNVFYPDLEHSWWNVPIGTEYSRNQGWVLRQLI